MPVSLAEAFEDAEEVTEDPETAEEPVEPQGVAEAGQSDVKAEADEAEADAAGTEEETVSAAFDDETAEDEAIDDEAVEDEAFEDESIEDTAEDALPDEAAAGVESLDDDTAEEDESAETPEDDATGTEDETGGDAGHEIGRDAITRVMSHMSEPEEDDETLQADEPTDEPDAPSIARVVSMLHPHKEAETAEDDTEANEAEAEGHVEADGEFEIEADETETETSTLHVLIAEERAEIVEQDETDAAEEDDQPETAKEDETIELALSDEEEAGTDADLSDEEEADLMATLEQVRRDAEADQRADKEGRAVLERDDIDNNGNGVQRILEVTNTELEETEGTRRRSAIQHLKAAVLATRADRKVSKDAAAEDDARQIDQYREDLARVVRPRRPVEGIKPGERRLQPLVLVTEQRVDVAPDPASDEPVEAVRPRRVSTGLAPERSEEGNENIFADADSFAEFAERMEATELPDILEAAAAYASYVEGRPHFSRPQLMRAVANYEGGDQFDRELTLRSFGQLLRQGKIRKARPRPVHRRTIDAVQSRRPRCRRISPEIRSVRGGVKPFTPPRRRSDGRGRPDRYPGTGI